MGIIEDLDAIDAVLKEEKDPLEPYSIIVGGVPDVLEEEAENDDHLNSRVCGEDQRVKTAQGAQKWKGDH
ncbi:hypothetical protein IID10_14945 [candidate division KSB1 bacterium]|nr:hypothetical protein [candidate division KSB1 bacterium]